MNQTVIGTFDNTTDADDAVRDLVDAGIPRSAVQVHSQETGTTPPDEGTTHVSGDHDHAHPGFFERIERFFSNLVGDHDRPAEFSHYHEAIRRGGALVSVDLRDEDDFDRVKRVLDDAGAVDIDERAAQWQSSGYTPYRVGGADQSTVSTTGGHLGEGTQGASQDMGAGRTMAAGQTLTSAESATGGRTMGSMGAMSATAGMGTTSDTTGGGSSGMTGDTAGVTGTTTSGTPETNLDPMLERDAPSTLQPGAGSSLGLGADMGSTSGIGATAGMGSTSGMGTVSTTGASTPAGLTSGGRSASDDTGTGISSGMGMGTGSGMGSGSGVGASTGLATDGDLTSGDRLGSTTGLGSGSGSTTASGMPTTAGGTGTNREIASTVDTGTGMGTTGLGTDMGPLDADLDPDLDQDLDTDRRTGGSGASAFGATGATGDQALPVIEEELSVGKRKVQTGAYRVYTRTTTTPVTEDVTLREEHASIERRPVDRAATDADRKEAYVEVKETDETPVIQKTARVVEEVVVGKESSQRTETIHDTLRGTEVEVERVDGDGKNDSTLKSSRP